MHHQDSGRPGKPRGGKLSLDDGYEEGGMWIRTPCYNYLLLLTHGAKSALN